jgi:hypothetical protein
MQMGVGYRRCKWLQKMRKDSFIAEYDACARPYLYQSMEQNYELNP